MRGWRSGKPKAKAKPKKQKQELNLGIKRSRKQKIITPNNVDIPNSISIKTEIPEKKKKKDEDGLNRFFGCYLLTSLSPRFKGHSYIGFTVNPKRRIRQHNGEITSGAVRTKKKRPWEMVLCIHGFPTNVAALQFEWAWQHPRESVAVREAASTFKTLGGLANKIKLALTMLTLHTWQSMNLTVSFFSTKYMKHVAGSPSLPHQMKLHSCSMDELPCYMDNAYLHGCDDEDDFDSNDGEVSGNFSDDKVESSADDSMDLNLSSIHAPSCTRQKISDDLLERDPVGISGSMAGTLENIQSLHQFPVDVSGTTQSTLNELSQPCEEFWTEDVRASFPDIEEHMQPKSGIDVFENEMFPYLEEEHPSYYHLSVDVPSSTGNDMNEYPSFGKESEAEVLRGSCPIIEDHLQPFQQAGPSDGQQSPLVDSVSSIEDVTKKDEIACIVIDDITQEQCQPTRAHSPSRFSNTIRPYSSQGIEVIELCTPSPDIRITRGGSKKKRTNSGFPDVIDLTRSPSFVQL